MPVGSGTIINVQVPAQWTPGQPLQVVHDGMRLTVMVPPGIEAGGLIQVRRHRRYPPATQPEAGCATP